MTKKIFILDRVPEEKKEDLDQHIQKMFREKGVDVYIQSELEDGYASINFLNDMDEIHLCIDDESNPNMVRMLVLGRVLDKPVIYFASEKGEEDTVGQNDRFQMKSILSSRIDNSKWLLRVTSLLAATGLLVIIGICVPSRPILISIISIIFWAIGIIPFFAAAARL